MKAAPDRGELVAFAAVAVVIAGVLGVAWRARAHARREESGATGVMVVGREIHVPHAIDVLDLDGELDEPSWLASARSGPFVGDDGLEASPYSDARFVWTDRTLRIGLYAADEDIVSAKVASDGPVWKGDAFHVVVTTGGVERAMDVGPKCTLTDGERRGGGAVDYGWQSHAKLACDADGTIDIRGDRDEEWVVEMEVPFSALDIAPSPGSRIDIRIRRCDVSDPPAAHARCGETRSLALVLDSR